MRETEILEKISHKNIIKMYHHFLEKENSQNKEEWHLNIIMEYAQGGDLAKVIDI